MGRGYEFYEGLYFWRLNKKNMRVGVLNLQQDGTVVWDESEMFQHLVRSRFENWMRWISKDVFFKEVKRPLQVKDANVIKVV